MVDEQQVLAILRAADPAARVAEPERDFDPLRQRVTARITRLERGEDVGPSTGKERPMQTTIPATTADTPPRRRWAPVVAVAVATVVAVAAGTLVLGRATDTPDTVTPVDSVYEEGSVLHVLDTDGRFDTFLDLVEGADRRTDDRSVLDELRSDSFDRTLFVPTDDAFAELGDETLAGIVDGPNLSRLLFAHIVIEGQGGLRAGDLVTKRYQNPGAASLTQVTVDGARISYGSATVIESDLEATNGIVHVIDAVVVPWES